MESLDIISGSNSCKHTRKRTFYEKYKEIERRQFRNVYEKSTGTIVCQIFQDLWNDEEQRDKVFGIHWLLEEREQNGWSVYKVVSELKDSEHVDPTIYEETIIKTLTVRLKSIFFNAELTVWIPESWNIAKELKEAYNNRRAYNNYSLDEVTDIFIVCTGKKQFKLICL